jgi:hypothetical protein
MTDPEVKTRLDEYNTCYPKTREVKNITVEMRVEFWDDTYELRRFSGPTEYGPRQEKMIADLYRDAVFGGGNITQPRESQ